MVKTLLPDAAGTTLFKGWNMNEVDSVYNFWYLQNVYNRNELQVFAFIQDESTAEIHQATLNKIDFVTGIKDLPQNSDNQLIVYPNPAENRAFVRLGQPVIGIVRLNIYNNLGALVKTVEIPGTTDETEISTAMFPDGIYIIRAVSGSKILGIQKLNVNH